MGLGWVEVFGQALSLDLPWALVDAIATSVALILMWSGMCSVYPLAAAKLVYTNYILRHKFNNMLTKVLKFAPWIYIRLGLY